MFDTPKKTRGLGGYIVNKSAKEVLSCINKERNESRRGIQERKIKKILIHY